MKFGFCGDADCPDWLLAGINLLSQMNSLNHKMLCSVVMESLIEDTLNMEKVEKLSADAKFDDAERRTLVSTLAYMLRGAARHGVAADQLRAELEQLGLPTEHAAGVTRVLADGGQQLRGLLEAQLLKLPGLAAVDWQLQRSAVQLQLTRTTDPTPISLQLSLSTAHQLHAELKRARARLDELA